MKALNFYSAVYHANLIAHEKRCTIRLGDKSGKYADGDIVWVTYGNRFEPRRKVFAAVIDRVDVKLVRELSHRDIRSENPDMHSIQEVIRFLEAVYGRDVTADSTVTVIYFSPIVEDR
ncbi:MAG TPA: ASCH domain-containing protein [Bacillota bacterium]